MSHLAPKNTNHHAEWAPVVGQRVRAKILILNDLTCDGMGIHHCASKGDVLIVREVGSGEYRNCIVVSKERTPHMFGIAVDEIEPVDSGGDEEKTI